MNKTILKYLNDTEEEVTLTADEDTTIILLGIEPGSKELNIELKKAGASANILGIFIGHEGEMKIRTIQHHLASNTTSDLLFKTILFNNARFDYQGLIKIDKVAQNSNAYQRNDNILMSGSSHSAGQGPKVDTKPELEILANEVRCTHGATIGKLDEEQIYYLMTRGLSRDKAVEILLEGFLGEVIERIDDEEKREEIKKIIIEKLRN